MPNDAFHDLDAVARHLPFGVAEYERANEAFRLWREQGREEDRKLVDLWVYCYVQRYFIIRFMEERGSPGDIDRCVSRAFEKTQKAYGQIEEEDKFASYVSVVCKRTLLNHRRRRRESVELNEQTLTAEPVAIPTDDVALIRHVLLAAISMMPKAIRKVGRLRYLEAMEYEPIAEQTGIAIATVRTYAARVAGRLRDDPDVRALHFDDLLPPDIPPEDR